MNKKRITIIALLIVVSGYKVLSKRESMHEFQGGLFSESAMTQDFNEAEKLIIKGEHFDIRCLYYDDKDIENSVWQLVKKGDDDIEIDKIEINNQDGVELIQLINRQYDTFNSSATIIGYIGNEDEYVYLYTFPNEKIEYIGKADFLKDHEKDARDKLIIKVYYDNASEEFNIEVHIDDQYERLKEMNERRIKGEYKKYIPLQKLSYLYYASLYRIDFDAWYQEMNGLLDNGGFSDALFFSDAKMVKRAFHLSYNNDNTISEERLRAILDLNDAQYEKYKSTVKKAYEKGVFTNVLSFLLT